MRHPQLLEELRDLLREGATPSRLIRHIDSALGSASSRDVAALLAEAFCLPVVRLGPRLDRVQKAVLCRTWLPEIIQNRERWDTAASSPPTSSWLDGVRAQDPSLVWSELTEMPYPGVSPDSWEALTADEQKGLWTTLVSGTLLSQRVELLSRLAERLQDRVDELEHKLSSADLPAPS